jgi:hypothetical protein
MGYQEDTISRCNSVGKGQHFIFIETTSMTPQNDNDFIYRPTRIWRWWQWASSRTSYFGKDAIFLFPDDLGNGMVETLTTLEYERMFLNWGLFRRRIYFTNENPYGNLWFHSSRQEKHWTVDPGSIYFHANSN